MGRDEHGPTRMKMEQEDAEGAEKDGLHMLAGKSRFHWSLLEFTGDHWSSMEFEFQESPVVRSQCPLKGPVIQMVLG